MAELEPLSQISCALCLSFLFLFVFLSNPFSPFPPSLILWPCALKVYVRAPALKVYVRAPALKVYVLAPALKVYVRAPALEGSVDWYAAGIFGSR